MADDFSHEEQAKRLYGLGEMEREALECYGSSSVKPSAARILTPNLLSERGRLLTVTTAPRCAGTKRRVIAFRRD